MTPIQYKPIEIIDHMENANARFMASLYVSLLLDIADQYDEIARGDLAATLNLAVLEHNLLERGKEGDVGLFTKVLPTWGRQVDCFLTTGKPVEGIAPHWFLQELWDIFLRTGQPVVLQHVRQLSYLYYKYELPYESETAQAVIESFVSNEVSLSLVKVDQRDPVIRKARAFISRVFSGLDPRDIVPRHGPGAVATGENVVEKTRFRRVYRQLERVYPFTEYMSYSLSHVVDRYRSYPYLEELEAGTAKVVLVPKDSRGPRLISCEPLEYQWIQQGLSREIVDRIESHWLTRGHVNFTDQGVNQRLALEGSRTLQWDTLDMKDASDLVSLELVTELFSGTMVLEGLLASRTPETKLPNGTLVQMRKFAPMGSALCFPVESMIFYALAVACLQVHSGYSPKRARESVYVYGDDIVVQRGNFPVLRREFERVGLRFNELKSATGEVPFRESCGVDAFKGVVVTPLRVKSPMSAQMDCMTLASYVAYSNAMWDRGLRKAATFIERMVSRFYTLPYTETLRGYVSWVRPYASRALNDSLGFEYRWTGLDRPLPRDLDSKSIVADGTEFLTGAPPNAFSSYQRLEIKALSLRPVVIKTNYDDWESLLRRFSIGGSETHAGSYSLPRRAKLKRGWVEV